MCPRLHTSAATVLPEKLLREIQAYCSGCTLYIPKQPAHARGKRQVKILAFHTQGLQTKEIALRVGASTRYVRLVLAQARQRTSAGEIDAHEENSKR
ncbi:MAG TPA: hypothetical protein VGL77_02050 [Armatimonadota bacterium]|jgi:DNA-binding NarL/FixJ family response regulator